MAVGCLAEVIIEIGPAAGKYLDAVIPLVQQGLVDSMEGVRRNAAFCVAAIIESLGPMLSTEQVGQLLQWLYPLCIRDESKKVSDSGGADIDNALSAVARMINKIPAAIPLAQVLPVLLAALPLRADPLEGPIVYGCLIKLLDANEPTAVAMFSSIITALAQTFVPDSKINAETRELIKVALKKYSSTPEFQQLASQITDPAIVAAIQEALST